ncbi:MAG: succinylglutamate-semialdehyde dehydrogenase [Gammaproteobacteria bacterium]|nr:MAG: succinylglutamate-semialdehyde dehydrogenase [Gammaproteobacteria bacterium]
MNQTVNNRQNCFIDGAWVKGSGALLTSTNPSTNEVVWQANAAGADDVATAFSAADKAFQDWALTPLADRIAILEKYKTLLEDNKEQLAKDIMNDTGKPWWESLAEVASMVGKIDVSIQSYRERTPTKSAGEADKTLLTHRPHGVCAVFGPYNFPGHLPNGHIVPALIAGNTIVFKPSEQTPTIGASMVQLLHDAGVPHGVINFVPGELETAKAIVANDALRGFFFTGSSTVGEIIHKQFAGRFDVILALEMGGNNPLIVLDDVLQDERHIDAAVYNTIQSAFVTAGQRCTCARRLIVPAGRAGDVFIARLVEETQKLLIDEPTAEKQPFFSMLINNRAADGLLAAQEKLLALGGQSLLEMQRLSSDKPVITPAIIDVTGVDGVPDEEYFGPLLKVYRVASLDEAISVANDTQYGLSSGIFTEDETAWQTFYALTHAGIVNRNKPLTGASGAAPFGGTGRSGNHNPGAYYAADYCAYPVASVTGEKLLLPETQTHGVSIG